MSIMHNAYPENIQPSKILVENIDLLMKGRVLDVAMGGGRNSVYLASKGFDVKGIDISGEAIDLALDLARESGVKIKAIIADLEKGYHIEKNHYDVIICFNYLQRSLIPQIKEGLLNGGIVIYETYTLDQRKFGKPKNPEHLLKPNELLDMFRDFKCLRYFEGICDNRRAIASIIAVKTG